MVLSSLTPTDRNAIRNLSVSLHELGEYSANALSLIASSPTRKHLTLTSSLATEPVLPLVPAV